MGTLLCHKLANGDVPVEMKLHVQGMSILLANSTVTEFLYVFFELFDKLSNTKQCSFRKCSVEKHFCCFYCGKQNEYEYRNCETQQAAKHICNIFSSCERVYVLIDLHIRSHRWSVMNVSARLLLIMLVSD